jgi:hypothetical protein
MKRFLLFLLVLSPVLFAASLPTMSLRNQFGEVQNDFVLSGSGVITAKFIVDNTQPLGQRNLTVTGGQALQGISQVFMNTSGTPPAGLINPSPGYIVVQFATGYSGHLNDAHSLGAPASGTPVNVTSGLSAGNPYVISSVGTTTQAQWQFLGLPAGLLPTVSQAFLAVTGSGGTGTGVVMTQKASGSGIDHLEVVGLPTLGIQTGSLSGGQIILVALAATSSSTTTFTPTAPAAGSVIELQFDLTPVAGSPL